MAREEFIKEIENIPPENIVYVDESGVDNNRVEGTLKDTPSHTTVRAMSHTAVSDLCLPKAS